MYFERRLQSWRSCQEGGIGAEGLDLREGRQRTNLEYDLSRVKYQRMGHGNHKMEFGMYLANE